MISSVLEECDSFVLSIDHEVNASAKDHTLMDTGRCTNVAPQSFAPKLKLAQGSNSLAVTATGTNIQRSGNTHVQVRLECEIAGVTRPIIAVMKTL